jgi:hypothetical protein
VTKIHLFVTQVCGQNFASQEGERELEMAMVNDLQEFRLEE